MTRSHNNNFCITVFVCLSIHLIKLTRRLRPLLRPYFFSTSRKFMLMCSNTMHKWLRCIKLRISSTVWYLPVLSSSFSFLRISSSFRPALYLRWGGKRCY